ncbi:MAG: transcription termination/antitermination protein NusA [Chloroflexi bacterium]|nr:transcription termination/antitermination protein NusA [Chloroflexota bacterium]
MKNDFATAMASLAREKGVEPEDILQALTAALIAAYRRDVNAPPTQRVSVEVDRQTGRARVSCSKTVVGEVRDPQVELALAEARRLSPDAAPGDTIEVESTPSNFGRIAAQTAKQVVLQRLREAERDRIYREFAQREGELILGILQRSEPRGWIVDLGRAEAVLPPTEQVPTEPYRAGLRLKFYLVEVERTSKGPVMTVSRTHRGLLRRLLELEVPEVFQGLVELKAMAREPGSRSKVAVAARQAGLDPVGACDGPRGVRIQNVVSELLGEKIDVIQWHAEPATFVANALSPAQVVSVELDHPERTATVLVPERQLSLAIGKEGQNARLAAKLTGWRIDIKAAEVAAAPPAATLGGSAEGIGR